MAENIGQVFKDIRDGDYRADKVAERLLESVDEASHEGTLSVFVSAISYLASRDEEAVDDPEVYRKLNKCLRGLPIGDSSLEEYPEDRYDAFDALEELPTSANPNRSPVHFQNMIAQPQVHELNEHPTEELLDYYSNYGVIEVFEGHEENKWSDEEVVESFVQRELSRDLYKRRKAVEALGEDLVEIARRSPEFFVDFSEEGEMDFEKNSEISQIISENKREEHAIYRLSEVFDECKTARKALYELIKDRPARAALVIDEVIQNSDQPQEMRPMELKILKSFGDYLMSGERGFDRYDRPQKTRKSFLSQFRNQITEKGLDYFETKDEDYCKIVEAYLNAILKFGRAEDTMEELDSYSSEHIGLMAFMLEDIQTVFLETEDEELLTKAGMGLKNVDIQPTDVNEKEFLKNLLEFIRESGDSFAIRGLQNFLESRPNSSFEDRRGEIVKAIAPSLDKFASESVEMILHQIDAGLDAGEELDEKLTDPKKDFESRVAEKFARKAERKDIEEITARAVNNNHKEMLALVRVYMSAEEEFVPKKEPESFAGLFRKGDKEVKRLASSILRLSAERTGARKYEDTLNICLEEEDEIVKKNALKGLSYVGTEHSSDKIKDLKESRNPEIQVLASKTLRNLNSTNEKKSQRDVESNKEGIDQTKKEDISEVESLEDLQKLSESNIEIKSEGDIVIGGEKTDLTEKTDNSTEVNDSVMNRSSVGENSEKEE